LWIGTQSENADRVLAALAAFGFDSLGIKKGDLVAPNKVIQMGFPPIDLLTSIDGVSFAECYERRMIVEVDGLPLGFIALEDFKTNKKAVGRYKDLADLEALESVNKAAALDPAVLANPKNLKQPLSPEPG
jgi:hypothetical protein